jgi:hypothetical protein
LIIEKSLNNLLTHYGYPAIPNYVETQTKRISDIITLEEIWKTIEVLANKILNSPNYRLERTDIEKVFINSGYWDFIKKEQ